jgi:predicted nucleic acid-binding protein
VSVVVSDTGPLHYLILCGVQELLPRLFEQVFIPPTVFRELQHGNTPEAVRNWVQSRPAWLKVQAPVTLDQSLNVDRGELEAICLAKEIGATIILLDDRVGRVAAIRYGLAVTGTLGVLELAARRGWIDLANIVAKLQQTNARLDPELLRAALARENARRQAP